jgi:hypothetical protein
VATLGIVGGIAPPSTVAYSGRLHAEAAVAKVLDLERTGS